MISSMDHEIVTGVSGTRYRRGMAIGQGAFGKVFMVTSLDSNK